VHPSHLQVGVGTVTTARPITHDDIVKECPTYHGYRVGLIHWHLQIDTAAQRQRLAYYEKFDKALNPDGPQRGTPGQPMQGPLGPQRLAAFAAAGAAEKGPAKPGG
jgi:hypothetical protein